MRTPHVLLIAHPFQGHISPMMQFSKRLASKGLEVTMVCPSSAIVLNNSIKIEYFSYENDQTSKTPKEYMANIQKQASDKLVQVIEEQKRCGRPFDVLVHDSLMPWAVDFGHQHGLRVACFCTQTCAVNAIYYLVFQGNFKFPLEEGSSLSFLPPSIPIRDVRDLPSDLYDERHPGVLDVLAGQFSHAHKDDWILCNTFLQLENEVSIIEYSTSVKSSVICDSSCYLVLPPSLFITDIRLICGFLHVAVYSLNA